MPRRCRCPAQGKQRQSRQAPNTSKLFSSSIRSSSVIWKPLFLWRCQSAQTAGPALRSDSGRVGHGQQRGDGLLDGAAEKRLHHRAQSGLGGGSTRPGGKVNVTRAVLDVLQVAFGLLKCRAGRGPRNTKAGRAGPPARRRRRRVLPGTRCP